LPKGQYKLKFEFIGFTTIDTILELSSDYDLGDIKMTSSARYCRTKPDDFEIGQTNI